MGAARLVTRPCCGVTGVGSLWLAPGCSRPPHAPNNTTADRSGQPWAVVSRNSASAYGNRRCQKLAAVFHQAIFRAKRDLNAWAGDHLPSLADDASSAEAAEMVIALSRLVRLMQIQFSAMSEQWSQDEWARRDQDTDSQM